MKRLGRINWVLVSVVGIVLLFGSSLLFGSESPQSVGSRFMTALAKGDVDQLAELSYPQERKEDFRKQWDWAVNVAGPHYRFVWKVTGFTQLDEDTASVRMMVARNVMTPGTYEEKFELPMVREDNTWRVDVRAVNREMYPGLPR
jgi:hypothetical protein